VNLDSKTGKTIESIKDKQKFKEVLTAIVDSDDTRTGIAQANKEIQKVETNKKGEKYPEYAIDDAIQYSIRNIQDITRYLTASLSDKDISYVMTENDFKSEISRVKGVENDNTKTKSIEEKDKKEFDDLISLLNTGINGLKASDDITDSKYTTNI
jgi:hypothetical protein